MFSSADVFILFSDV